MDRVHGAVRGERADLCAGSERRDDALNVVWPDNGGIPVHIVKMDAVGGVIFTGSDGESFASPTTAPVAVSTGAPLSIGNQWYEVDRGILLRLPFGSGAPDRCAEVLADAGSSDGSVDSGLTDASVAGDTGSGGTVAGDATTADAQGAPTTLLDATTAEAEGPPLDASVTTQDGSAEATVPNGGAEEDGSRGADAAVMNEEGRGVSSAGGCAVSNATSTSGGQGTGLSALFGLLLIAVRKRSHSSGS
jgi:hypothetical protein